MCQKLINHKTLFLGVQIQRFTKMISQPNMKIMYLTASLGVGRKVLIVYPEGDLIYFSHRREIKICRSIENSSELELINKFSRKGKGTKIYKFRK